jgi:hypothetical protein
MNRMAWLQGAAEHPDVCRDPRGPGAFDHRGRRWLAGSAMRSMSVTMGVPRKARFVRLRACDMVSEIAGDSGAGADGIFRARRGGAKMRSLLGVSATPSSIWFAALADSPTRSQSTSATHTSESVDRACSRLRMRYVTGSKSSG